MAPTDLELKPLKAWAKNKFFCLLNFFSPGIFHRNKKLTNIGSILRRKVARSCGRSVWHFVRNLYSIFHNVCASLHFHKEYTKSPFCQIFTSTYLLCFDNGHSNSSLWFEHVFSETRNRNLMYIARAWEVGCSRVVGGKGSVLRNGLMGNL
jgi:hypothetical protein